MSLCNTVRCLLKNQNDFTAQSRVVYYASIHEQTVVLN